MPDLQHLLQEIDRLDQEAEAAPWGHEPAVNTQNGWSLGTVRSDRTGESVAPEVYDPDGAFIALARTALPQLAEAVYQVLALLDAEENRPSRITAIDGLPRPARVPTGEVRQAITDAIGADDGTR